LTPLSALAVPVAIAIGATASAPAMVASPNVLRMFFTSILSPSAHHQHPRGSWAAPSRSGAAAGGQRCLAGNKARRPLKAETHLLVLCQPRLTRRFLVLKLFAPFEAVGTVQNL